MSTQVDSVAFNSHVMLRIAREGLADQKPDLFIIYSGNNEVVGPYGPGTMPTSAEGTAASGRLRAAGSFR